MIGRTNTSRSSASSGSDEPSGVTTIDLPTHLQSLTAAANSGRVILTLEYSDTDFVSGVDVLYKTDGYPASPTDGECVDTSSVATSVTIEGLTNGAKYFFRVYLYRLIDGVKYYQTDETNAKVYATPSAVGISGITPAMVADNYFVIDQSGAFILNIPEDLTVTAYLAGGGGAGDAGWCDTDEGSGTYSGGQGGPGGGTKTQVINSTGAVNCSCTIGSRCSFNNVSSTTLKVGSTTYSTIGKMTGGDRYGGDGYDGLLTPYGYIGSSGGGGGESGYSNGEFGGQGGQGAGNGGQGGSYYSSADSGYRATNYGCGGGGGGGGYDDDSGGGGGAGMQGCIIIGWV